jgi:hypothetical protein
MGTEIWEITRITLDVEVVALSGNQAETVCHT